MSLEPIASGSACLAAIASDRRLIARVHLLVLEATRQDLSFQRSSMRL